MTHTCKRCGRSWATPVEEPKRCGECGSALWRRDRVRERGAGRPKLVVGGGICVAGPVVGKKRQRPVVIKAVRVEDEGQVVERNPDEVPVDEGFDWGI